jgi:hypothetical protein
VPRICWNAPASKPKPIADAGILVSQPPLVALNEKSWCQRRDSNSQTPVSKTGRYSNSRTLALWCTGEDLNLRRPTQGKPGLRPGRFSQTHAPVQIWRKVDESNAHGSSPCPGFQDQLPAIQQYLPRWRRVRESNPLASCESPCLADKCLTVRPTLRQKLSKNLVGPVGFEPTRGLLLRQLRMPVPPRAWLIKLKLDRGSVTQSGSTEES